RPGTAPAAARTWRRARARPTPLRPGPRWRPRSRGGASSLALGYRQPADCRRRRVVPTRKVALLLDEFTVPQAHADVLSRCRGARGQFEDESNLLCQAGLERLVRGAVGADESVVEIRLSVDLCRDDVPGGD